MVKAIALLSGGLDSMLAIAIVKAQGVEIEAVNFHTIFGCCKDDAGQAARKLGVPCTLLKVGDDYLQVVEKPKYGYGRGANPCVDCRSYMFTLGKNFMEKAGAQFLISGEVLDQRPMSQKLKDFYRIEEECGLQKKILRPLSAKRLPLTEAEENGWINRSKLFGIQGRSRKKLLSLAAQFGIDNPPMPSSGCALTSPEFGKKVKDVFKHHPDYERWQFEILRIGRHFRLDSKTKVVISRNDSQNSYLEMICPPQVPLLKCSNFGGPHAVLIGAENPQNLELAGKLILRYAQKPLPEKCEIEKVLAGRSEIYFAHGSAEENLVEQLRIV